MQDIGHEEQGEEILTMTISTCPNQLIQENCKFCFEYLQFYIIEYSVSKKQMMGVQ